MEQDFSLKDFIKQSLTEICDAVIEARTAHEQVAPIEDKYDVAHASRTLIEFDVAVTVTEANRLANEAGGKAGMKFNIGVASGSVGAEGASEKTDSNERSHLSRIKFSIPVYFQHDEAAAKDRRARSKEAIKNANNSRDSQGW